MIFGKIRIIGHQVGNWKYEFRTAMLWLATSVKKPSTAAVSVWLCLANYQNLLVHSTHNKIVWSICGMFISLWPSNALWWCGSGSTLTPQMAGCLMAPSDYPTKVDFSSESISDIHLSALHKRHISHQPLKSASKSLIWCFIQISRGPMIKYSLKNMQGYKSCL